MNLEVVSLHFSLLFIIISNRIALMVEVSLKGLLWLVEDLYLNFSYFLSQNYSSTLLDSVIYLVINQPPKNSGLDSKKKLWAAKFQHY